MTFWTRASKHMFPKRFTKMINGTENLKFAKRKAWYKEFRCKSQTVGTALNVKRTYKWHSKHKRRYRWTNLKKIEMDCNCGFRKLISLTVSYSKFPFCCLQHLKLGDTQYLFDMKLIFSHSRVQCNFSISIVNNGLWLALLYIALITSLLIGLKSLQLILEISATYSLVTYLLTDNWPICRLCVQCMISNNNCIDSGSLWRCVCRYFLQNNY